jgi:hypothetical protein
MATAMAAIESRSEALSTAFVTVEVTVEIMVVGEVEVTQDSYTNLVPWHLVNQLRRQRKHEPF